MIIDGVDPRDIEWDVERPTYRVDVWERPSAPEGVAQEAMAYHRDTYRISDADDVDEVLAWARATTRPGQTFSLYVECRDDGRLGLIRLAGVDPTAGGTSDG